jgi:acylglycerol lipase
VIHRATNPRAALVLSHGVMSHAGWLQPLCEALAQRGITAAAVDRPGSGQRREDPGACEPERWIAGLTEAVEALRGEGAPVSLLGWCWGARTAVLAAERVRPDRLVLAAPGLVMAEAVRARATALAAGDADPVPLPFAIEAFSDEPRVIDFIRADRLAWTGQPRAFLAPSRAVLGRALAVLPALDLPVHVLLAERDRIVDNAATTAMLSAATLRRLPGGHALVLEDAAAVADAIAAALLA